MEKPKIDETIEKIEKLDPEDPLRRGILECLADWLLHRNKKNEQRVEKRASRLKY